MGVDLKNIAKILTAGIDNLKGIYLFGSYASGDAKGTSDIDLAVLTDKKVDAVALFDLAQTIAVQENKDVDLVDMRSISTVFATEIVSTAERIYCADEYACESFEGLIFAMYVRLSEERKIIIDQIKRTGRIYEKRSR